MGTRNVLYISGSFGLGHINRDLAIARELRRRHPEVAISWLAAEPARTVLREAGEELLPEAANFRSDSEAVESASRGHNLNLMIYCLKALHPWRDNVAAYVSAVRRRPYDLTIADECYEIMAMMIQPKMRSAPFIMIFDFFGFESTSRNPLERAAVHFWNWVWSQDARRLGETFPHAFLFVGELDDIPGAPRRQ